MTANRILGAMALAFVWGLTCGYAHAGPNDTSMGNGAWLASSAPQPDNTLVGWTGCMSTAVPPHGCVIQFLAPDATGRMVSGVALNGGVIAGGGPTTNSDLDFWTTVDNQLVVIAMTGKYLGNPPMLHTWPPGIYQLGSPTTYWAGIYLTKYSCPASLMRMVPEPDHCVLVNGGYSPVFTK